jgi:hypothetical protein
MFVGAGAFGAGDEVQLSNATVFVGTLVCSVLVTKFN